MKDKNLSCKVEEVAACCCVDVGTIIDNNDLTVSFSQIYHTENQALEALKYLTNKANEAALNQCQINSNIKKMDDGFQLTADFTFECQAESMIFQLATR